MIAYILRRILMMIPTLFGIMVLNFIIVQAAPGGERTEGGGVAHTGTRSRPDRARRLRAHGRVLRIIPVADRGTEKPSDHDAFAVSPPFSPVGAHVGPGGALPAGVANHATGG